MPRTPVAIVARLSRISVRATDMEIELIESLRGTQSTSDYIRDLVQADAQRKRAMRNFTPQEKQD